MCTTFLARRKHRGTSIGQNTMELNLIERVCSCLTSFVHIRAASSKLCTQLHGNIKENLPDDHSPTSSTTLDGVKCP